MCCRRTVGWAHPAQVTPEAFESGHALLRLARGIELDDSLKAYRHGTTAAARCPGAVAPDSASPGRNRRSSPGPPISSEHIECRIFLDADASFYEHWKPTSCPGIGDECLEFQLETVTAKMLGMLAHADDVFAGPRSNVTVAAGRAGAGGVGFRLGVLGTHIETDYSRLDLRGADAPGVLSRYAEWHAQTTPQVESAARLGSTRLPTGEDNHGLCGFPSGWGVGARRRNSRCRRWLPEPLVHSRRKGEYAGPRKSCSYLHRLELWLYDH